MSALETYRQKKEAKRRADQWIAMYGKQYYGGGGGIGRLVYMETKPTIYYQENNGDTNYHEAPKGFQEAFSEVVKANFKDLSAAALAHLDAGVKAAAIAADEEHRKILADIESAA
jgi:hypothetical protein